MKKLTKPKVRSHKVIKKETWTIFSLYIRTRDAIKTTKTLDNAKCYTCDFVYPIKNLQAGHFIPGRKNAFLFDENQVHAQCFRCNGPLKGNWVEYIKNLTLELGKDTVDEMINRKYEIKQLKSHDLITLKETYKGKLEALTLML